MPRPHCGTWSPVAFGSPCAPGTPPAICCHTACPDHAGCSTGLPRWVVMFLHVLLAALLPFVTQFGLRPSCAIAGSLVIETVFALPGLGSWMVDSIMARDYMVVQTLTLAFAVGVMLINL